VNSVRRREDGALIGFNTDAPGFQRAAETELGVRFLGIRAAVAGAGGVARAVVDALVVAGAESVVVCDLVPKRAVELAADAGEKVRAVELGTSFEECLSQVDLAVNATTVGMIQAGVPFDPTVLPESAVVYDLVYTPPETELLRSARGLGLPATNGLGTLVAQAEIAFERWTGVPDAAPIMRAALVAMPEGSAFGAA
jgi:shikimate dehydrogenase